MSYLITTLFTLFLLLICLLFVTYSNSNGDSDKFDILKHNNPKDSSTSDVVENGFELLGILTSVQLMYNFLTDLWDRSDDYVELRTAWLCSIIGALAVVSAGIVPALLLPVDSGPSLHSGGSHTFSKILYINIHFIDAKFLSSRTVCHKLYTIPKLSRESCADCDKLYCNISKSSHN